MESLKKTAFKYAVRGLYNMISFVNPDSNLTVLNYGFYNGQEIPADPEDEPNLLRLSLYHHVASAVDLSGKDVLEVGSGRGGGLSYVARHLSPRTAHGVDLSGKAISFCTSYYDVPGLSFSQGDAENLDLEDNSYDVILNIESSHNYPNMPRFASEAHRVLRPKGHLLLADMRPTSKVAELRNILVDSGFRIVSEEDITPNVLSALDRDSLKEDFIKQQIPKLLRRPFSMLAGVRGTHFYNKLQMGDRKYISFVLQKQ